MSAKPDATSASRRLAEYATATTMSSIPQHVRNKARLCIIDTLGCLIGGSATQLGGRIAKYVLERSGSGSCRIIGTQLATRPESAVLANSAFAHILELDDGHRPSDNHLGCAVVPAALSIAQDRRVSGPALLRAVIHGYDVMGRIGQAVCLPRVTSFHHTATTATFGAATAAGLLIDLSCDQLANAIGIAGTGASGLWQVSIDGVDCKSLQVGRAASSGVGAAFLAREGVSGSPKILEGPHGFVRAFTSEPRSELLLSDLGTRFAVEESAFKVHAACGNLFTAIDAALLLRKRHLNGLDRVERVSVAIPSALREDSAFGVYRPATAGAARFSVPFTTAAALAYGEVTIRQISDDGIKDDRIAKLESKVKLVDDEEIERIYEDTKGDDYFFYPSRVTLHIEDGDHSQMELSPRGYDPRRALDEDEIFQKFIGNTEHILGAQLARQVLHQFSDIVNVQDVGDMVIFK